METMIYFKERERGHGVIRFVKSYRKKGFLRKERIEYSLSSSDGFMFADAETVEAVKKRVLKDYPGAKVYESDWNLFMENYKTHCVWVIVRVDKKNQIGGFYYGISNGEYIWTSDIEEAEMGFDYASMDETLLNIRKATGERLYCHPVYTDLVNGLLEPNFMITCTSKRGKEETRYFKRMDGNRLRLVYTSDAAMKFTYSEVLSMFEYLQSENKRFLYAVFPVFNANVHCRDLENYVREANVSRMVQMTTKLKWLNR